MRKRVLLTFGLGLFLVLTARFFWPKKPEVQTAKAARKNLSVYVETSGKVRASHEAALSFALLAPVEMVASVGANVKKGETLARLQSNELWANLEQAFANLNKARSNFYYYLEVKSQTDTASAWKEDPTSRALVNQANNNVAAAKDSEQAAQFAVDSARAAYNKAFIRAPFDGVVGSVSLKVGETSQLGLPVLTLVDPTSFYFEAEVDETDVALLKPGQSAKVSLDAWPGRELQARVGVIDLNPHPTISGGTAYNVRLSFKSLGEISLKPGFNGQAKILKEEKENALTVPANFVSQKDGRNFVVVLKDPSKVDERETRQVELGVFVDGSYEVTEGLTEGEVVAISKK